MDPPDPAQRYLRRVLLAVGVAAGAIVLSLLMWYGSEVLLMVFAGVLLAVFLRTLSEAVHRATRLPEAVSLAVTCICLIVIIGAAAWLMAPSIGRQVDQLAEQLPRAFNRLVETLKGYGWAAWLSDHSGQAGGDMATSLKQAATAVTRVVTVAANLVIIAFLGLYFATQPRLYLEGSLYLVPPTHRDRVRQVLDETGFELRWWLLGQFLAMLLIGTLTTIGLWLLQIPLALILGVIAGLLNFVPNFGPWIAAIPGVLIAVADSPVKGAYAVAVYAGVQLVESYIITPMVQQRTVDLPPAATIVSQVLMGILFGVLGLTMATPLLVVALVVVKMLYVEDVLGDRMRLPGRDRKPRTSATMIS